MLRRPLEPKRAAAIGVVNQVVIGMALVDGHVESIESEVTVYVPTRRPAHHSSGEQVDDDRQIQPTL